MKKIIKILFFPLVLLRRQYISYKHSPHRLFGYDANVFTAYSGSIKVDSVEARRAQIIMAYHVVEKGLTMPHPRLDFGHSAVLSLIELIDAFERDYGYEDEQVTHAVGVVIEYLDLHKAKHFSFEKDDGYWSVVIDFFTRHKSFASSHQLHLTREEFFAKTLEPFPAFAASRHTCRHYEGVLPIDVVKDAVRLAMTAPSACNRQHTRIHCISDHNMRDEVYKLQNGNRGFGSDADKLLVVTADLADIRWNEERNDIYTNAGIFTMNLCYALHYYHIAHCILNWSVPIEADLAMHRMASIPAGEKIVLLIACGPAPKNVVIATSPRKGFSQIFTEH